MITVAILINGQPLFTRSGYRINGDRNEVCTYHLDDGTFIKHNYQDGAVSLAHKMLDTIVEKPIAKTISFQEFLETAADYLDDKDNEL